MQLGIPMHHVTTDRSSDRSTASLRSPARIAAATPSGHLSRSTIASLRRVLHAFRDGWLLESRLGMTSRMVAEDAHRAGLPAERMLVALKHEWRALAEARDQRAYHDLLALQGRLVTMCIADYYRARMRATR